MDFYFPRQRPAPPTCLPSGNGMVAPWRKRASLHSMLQRSPRRIESKAFGERFWVWILDCPSCKQETNKKNIQLKKKKNYILFLANPRPLALSKSIHPSGGRCPCCQRWALSGGTISQILGACLTNVKTWASYRVFSPTPGTTHGLGCLFPLRFGCHSHWIQWIELFLHAENISHIKQVLSHLIILVAGCLIRTHHLRLGFLHLQVVSRSGQLPGHSYSKATLKEHLGSTGRWKR